MNNQLKLGRALPPLILAAAYLFVWSVVPDELRLTVAALGGSIVLVVSLAVLFGFPADAGAPGPVAPIAAVAATGIVLGTILFTAPPAPDPPFAGPGTPAPSPSLQGCSTSQPKGPLVEYANGLSYDRDRHHHPRRWDSRRLAVQAPGGGTRPGPRAAIFPQRNAHENTPDDLSEGRVVAEVVVAGDAGYPHLDLPPGKSWVMICAAATASSGYIALIIPQAAAETLRTHVVSVFTSDIQEPAAAAQFNEGEDPPTGVADEGTVTAAGALDDACVTCKITGWCRL